MRVKVRKVGNSLTVTIPKEIAVDIGIVPNMEMELSVENGSLQVTPVEDRLLRLLAEIRQHATDRGLTEEDIEVAIREHREQRSP